MTGIKFPTRRGRLRLLAAAVLVGLSLSVAATANAAPAAKTAAMPAVQLPKDIAPHDYPVEWWYFSGHLTATDKAGHKHAYGYEYVTFQFAEGKAAEYFGNASVTDLSRKTYQYGYEQATAAIPATKDSFDLHTGSWAMSGTAFGDQLHARTASYKLDLTMVPDEPAVLHGDKGIIPYGPFGTSAYYSYTRLATKGAITDHGVTMTVTGTSWMDHQWGDIDLASGGGWDWYSMQLSNGQQYMLYFIRDKAGQVVTTIATRVSPGDKVTHLAAGTYAEKALGSWTSPATKITYSSGWQVTVPGGTLTVSPDVLNQEVNLLNTPQGVAYWEGDVSIKGTVNCRPVHGEGYTEINPPGE